MNATKIQATIQVDGELHLTRLPVRRGDRVEAILLRLDDRSNEQSVESHDEKAEAAKRETARQEFLELAKSSTFHSTDRYPAREELHERR